MTIEIITVFLKPCLNCKLEAMGRAIIEVKTSIPTIYNAVDTAAATRIENT